jgi:hypothetical protein
LHSDTLKTTTPLLNKVLLTWLVDSYAWYRLSDEEKAAGITSQPRGGGFGVGLAFALFAMQGWCPEFFWSPLTDPNRGFQLGTLILLLHARR